METVQSISIRDLAPRDSTKLTSSTWYLSNVEAHHRRMEPVSTAAKSGTWSSMDLQLQGLLPYSVPLMTSQTIFPAGLSKYSTPRMHGSTMIMAASDASTLPTNNEGSMTSWRGQQHQQPSQQPNQNSRPDSGLSNFSELDSGIDDLRSFMITPSLLIENPSEFLSTGQEHRQVLSELPCTTNDDHDLSQTSNMNSVELDVTGTDDDDYDDHEDEKDDEENDLSPKRPSTPFDGEQTSANTDDDDGRESVNRSFLDPQKENEPNEKYFKLHEQRLQNGKREIFRSTNSDVRCTSKIIYSKGSSKILAQMENCVPQTSDVIPRTIDVFPRISNVTRQINDVIHQINDVTPLHQKTVLRQEDPDRSDRSRFTQCAFDSQFTQESLDTQFTPKPLDNRCTRPQFKHDCPENQFQRGPVDRQFPLRAYGSLFPQRESGIESLDNNYQYRSHHNQCELGGLEKNQFQYGSHDSQFQNGSHGNQFQVGSHDNQFQFSSHDNQFQNGSHDNQFQFGSHGNPFQYGSHDNQVQCGSHDNPFQYDSHDSQVPIWLT